MQETMISDKIILEVQNLGKKYQKEWVFKGLDFSVGNEVISVRGGNGSGKSTFLKCLIGIVPPTRGTITFRKNAEEISLGYRDYSFSAPYVDIIENITLQEYYDFYFKMKNIIDGMNYQKFVSLLELPANSSKRFAEYSTGMMQRVKIGFALCTDVPIVILDEPTSNLDIKAIDWYQHLLESTLHTHKMLIIASNEERDFLSQSRDLYIEDFK